MPFHERHEAVMADAIYLYLAGLVALAVGFVLYLYLRRQRHEKSHAPLICRTSLDKDGNLMRFILCPRSTPSPVPVVPVDILGPSGESLARSSLLQKPDTSELRELGRESREDNA